MSIWLKNISKTFGSDSVLTDVTQEIPEGSLTAMLGPSGSGKSTLLRIIAGLEKADSGLVEINGRDVSSVPVRGRNIGFCFQDYAPFNQLSVFDNIAYGLKVKKLSKTQIRQEVAELLALVRLDEYADRYPRQLSGGQRQRMALARALAIKPTVLLLDEPFAALDAQVGAEMRQWVRSLQHQLGITTILVTHNQSEAMEMADQLIILNEGRIVQAGTPAEVYESPKDEFVHSFLGPITTFEGTALRPHHLEFCDAGQGVGVEIVDVLHLGFEVRVTVKSSDGALTWVQLTHDEAQRKRFTNGDFATIRKRIS